jgi:SpoVK/Ycf46/Vps4 family AAA+-type ATPase
MFTINIAFTDALKAFEHLIKQKDELDPSFWALRGEFRMFAQRKADRGDHEAKSWLQDNKYDESYLFSSPSDIGDEDDTSATDSPLSFFKNPPRKTHTEIEKVLFELDLEDTSAADPAVTQETPLSPERIEEMLSPLNNLAGLDSVKQEIRTFALYAQAQKKRKNAGLKSIPSPALHMVFTGNPGCGKTTVARVLGGVFKDLGLVRKNSVTEVDRGDLVGEYIGETAQKTMRLLRKAKGGILFIDEAYALTYTDSPRDFGNEAISTLMKHMEDHRQDTVIIVAGYQEPMKHFLRSNPGLSSRFPVHIEFPDFNVEELVRIFDLLCQENDFILTDEARTKVHNLVKKQKREQESEFANGRAVRSLFEKTLRRQAERIILEDIEDAESLNKITAADMEGENVPVRVKEGNVTYLSDKHSE